MKKVLLATCLAVLLTGCNTATLQNSFTKIKNLNKFKSGEISEMALRHAVNKRQDVLETGDSKTPYHWNKDGINGMMYIVSTWKKPDGIYCRRMYERMHSGFKEAELYNEWCRVGYQQWALNGR